MWPLAGRPSLGRRALPAPGLWDILTVGLALQEPPGGSRVWRLLAGPLAHAGDARYDLRGGLALTQHAAGGFLLSWVEMLTHRARNARGPWLLEQCRCLLKCWLHPRTGQRTAHARARTDV